MKYAVSGTKDILPLEEQMSSGVPLKAQRVLWRRPWRPLLKLCTELYGFVTQIIYNFNTILIGF